MAEPGTARQKNEIIPPMEEKYYRITARSHHIRVVFSIILSVVFAWLSQKTEVPAGFGPMLLIGFGFAYGMTGKLFPDSDCYFGTPAKNYRRAKRGKELLAEDQSRDLSYFDEFRKG